MHPYLSQALAAEHIRDARKRAASARRVRQAIAARVSSTAKPATTTEATGRTSARPVPARRLARGA